ncbi:hypothetical protein [Limnobacter parvus]|uniref:Uncharacterized protein n=1 Tax=Limnobacter parvus TaxID=2939690 RepID=A0ABT1XMB4_9BURK|nr:hypothetical protein [Limnobacter parvus]MCR2747229.1 hypothetical protein [Limnobacter parvus]
MRTDAATTSPVQVVDFGQSETGVDLELMNLFQTQGLSKEDAQASVATLSDDQKKIMLSALSSGRDFTNEDLVALGFDPSVADNLLVVQNATTVYGLPLANFSILLIQLLRESSAESKKILKDLLEARGVQAEKVFGHAMTAAFIDIGFGAATAGVGTAIGVAGALKGSPKLNDKGQPVPSLLDKFLPSPIAYSTVSQGWNSVGQGVSGIERAKGDMENYEKEEITSLYDLAKTAFDEDNQLIHTAANTI